MNYDCESCLTIYFLVVWIMEQQWAKRNRLVYLLPVAWLRLVGFFFFFIDGTREARIDGALRDMACGRPPFVVF